MPTQQELDAQLLAATGGGGDGGILESIKTDTIKSLRAAGMMVGLYKPETSEEAKELRRRFAADAAMLAASSITGGVAGAALKGARPVARAILGGALSFGAGGAAQAAVEGENVPIAAGTGAVLGAGFAGLGAGLGGVRSAIKAAGAATAAEKAALATAKPTARVLTPRQAAVAKRTEALAQREAATELRYAGTATPYRQTEAAAEAEIRNARLQAVYETPVRTPIEGAPAPADPFGQRLPAALVDPFEPGTVPGVAPFESMYRGPASQAAGTTRPIGARLRAVEESGVTVPRVGQARDARGRFTAKQAAESVATKTTGLESATTLNAEGQMLAREASELGNEGRVLARLPRDQRGYRGPRMGARGKRSVEAGVSEAFDAGEAEVVDLATANSIARRTLMKLGGGIDRSITKGTGKELDVEGWMLRVYNDVADLSRRALMPAGSALARMGQYGAELGARMSGTLDRAMRLASQDIEAIRGLAKLSLVERRNVGHVLHGSDVPMNDKTAEIARSIRERLDLVGVSAKDVQLNIYSPRTGQTRPFALRENYYPLEYSPKTIRKYMQPGPEREEALKRIMQSEQGISRSEAEAVLYRYLHPHLSEFRYGHLQMARDLALPGWEEDPLKVLPQYFMRGWKRIETAREFGPQDQLMKGLVDNMEKQGYDGHFGLRVYRAFADKEPLQLHDLAGATRTLNMLSLLSTTGLVQFGQHANIVALTGWKNYIQGMAQWLKKDRVTQEWAANTGAYMQELMQDLVPFGQGGVGSWWASTIGLTPLDKANRIVAALAGRFHADDIAAKYVKETVPKTLAKYERQLVGMGLTPAEVKAAGGVLTAEQRSLAAQQISLATQFRGSVLDMPIEKHSWYGQFLYLFKNFAVQQSRFVAGLSNEAFKHGNWEPMIKYLSATGTLTGATGAAVQAAKYGWSVGDAEVPGLLPSDMGPESEGLQRYLEGTLMAGAVGIAQDGLRGMFNGPEMLRSFLLGPTANDAMGLLGKDIPELVRGNPRQIMHDTIKHTPLFGRRLAEHLVPLDE